MDLRTLTAQQLVALQFQSRDAGLLLGARCELGRRGYTDKGIRHLLREVARKIAEAIEAEDGE